MSDDTQHTLAANTAFWDAAALHWEQRDLPPTVVLDLAERLACAPGSLLLDAGCGAGQWAVGLAQAGYRVQGIDVSLQMAQAVSWDATNIGTTNGWECLGPSNSGNAERRSVRWL